MLSRGKPLLLSSIATIKEHVVPYQPEVIKQRVRPIKIKFRFLFLKYFSITVIPKNIEINTTKRFKVPLRISKPVREIKNRLLRISLLLVGI